MRPISAHHRVQRRRLRSGAVDEPDGGLAGAMESGFGRRRRKLRIDVGEQFSIAGGSVPFCYRVYGSVPNVGPSAASEGKTWH